MPPIHRVRAVAPPPEGRLAARYHSADLVDAFAIRLPLEATHDMTRLAQAVLAEPPPWFDVLLGARDTVMAGFGVKTSAQALQAADAEGAEHIAFFRVLERTDDELIVGEPDRHLDFWAAIRRRPTALPGAELVVTTVVQCHNSLGRTYLRVIEPFHRIVVRSMLQRAALRGWPGDREPASS